MRGLIIASLAAAGLAGVFAHPGQAGGLVRRRKTLGFGPELPHAVFRLAQESHSFTASCAHDPFELAQRFVEDLTRDSSSASSFVIRKDSYTDNAGVSHVYARQYIHGIEVADGNINVNIKDGKVLSWGNSFFPGEQQDPFVSGLARGLPDAHSEYCNSLAAEMQARTEKLYEQSEQTTMGSSQEALGILPQLHEWNCAHAVTPFVMAANAEFAGAQEDSLGDPSRALLQFMIAATPNSELSRNMVDNPKPYLEKMSSSWESHFTGGHGSLSALVDGVPDTVNPVKAKVAFVQVPNGESMSLELVWKFEVEMEDNWYEAAVSASMPHRIISVVDWASDSPMPSFAPIPSDPLPGTYNVYPLGVNDPTDGNRSVQKENFDFLASPAGWHALPSANDPANVGVVQTKDQFHHTNTTWGNNVFAHENWEGRNAWLMNYRPEASPEMVFDFEYDPKETPREGAMDEARKYIDATVTQLFYTANMAHDLFYRYGFDEVSGNFQQYNFGRGGKQGDGVIANAQDGSGMNNANFMTPPDGQNGRCRMYLWNTAMPYRDGDLEAGIVIHELAHGLSTRLTGGPDNSGCLGWGESGGMGEGWGDFLATTIRSTSTYSDYAMGSWAANRATGIRNYPYSLNSTINPSTYKTLDKPGYWGVHAIGEVWAQILWVTSHNLIAKHGFSESVYPPKPSADGNVPLGDFYKARTYFDASGVEKTSLVPKHGNTLMIQLVIDGMKLQKCSPGFIEARDAIIQADEILTGGENACELWAGFARAGLGAEARVDGRTPWGGGVRKEDYEVPGKCADLLAREA